jgi:aryl-alcohol dehydrogenase-like predicted oxidoreductase
MGMRFQKPIVPEAIEAYLALAEERGLSPAQLALGYVAKRWYLGAQMIGATSLAQLEESIAAAQVELDAETMQAIAAIQQRFPNPAP